MHIEPGAVTGEDDLMCLRGKVRIGGGLKAGFRFLYLTVRLRRGGCFLRIFRPILLSLSIVRFCIIVGTPPSLHLLVHHLGHLVQVVTSVHLAD